MFRLRKEAKIILILFTIVFSIYLGFKRSNMDKLFMQMDVAIDASSANVIFNHSHNNNKIRFDYKVNDLSQINSLLAKINKMVTTNTLYEEAKSNYHLEVLEIPAEISNEVLVQLRKVDGLSNENIQRAGPVKESTDLKENLNNNQIAKKRIQSLIFNSMSPERILQFRNQLEIIQAKIDSLSSLKDIQKHNAEFDIIMLSAVGSVNGTAAIRRSMSIFVLTTIISLLLLIIGLIICFYIFVLMQKLMLAFGIKTAKGSRSSYNYYYNKKGYGRRTKTIYKDEDGNVIKKEEKE